MNRRQRFLTAGLALVTLGVAWYFGPSVHAPLSRQGPVPAPTQDLPMLPQPRKPVTPPSEPEAFEAKMASARDMQTMLAELTELAGKVDDAESARRFLDAVVQSLKTSNSEPAGTELVHLTPQHQRQLDTLWDDILEHNDRFCTASFDAVAKVSCHHGYGDTELKRAYDFAMVMFMTQKLPELRAQQERVSEMLIQMNERQTSSPDSSAPSP